MTNSRGSMRLRAIRGGSAPVTAWVRRASYAQKWLVLGLLIGSAAGLGAVAFCEALKLAAHILTGDLGGYTGPAPAGEGGGNGTGRFTRPWAIPCVVCLGDLASGFLVCWLAPEADGPGADAAIDAANSDPRKIRARVLAVKFAASAITIGSGGSGGREGPMALISAGFGSMLARRLDLSPEDGRIAVSAAIGAGIGAIFGAPLGGALTAAEIVYRDDFEATALIPGFIASATSCTIFGFAEGFAPLFGNSGSGYQSGSPISLLWFAIIGVIAGLVGLAYVVTFHGAVSLTRRLPGSRAIRPALGGLLAGLLMLAIPQVLGTGYGWVQHALDRNELLHMPLWIVLLLPFAKILATSFSIGTGGSGGIFGPGMVIGAFVGAAAWRLLEPWAAGVPHSPAPFVIVGMIACFGSASRTPLAMTIMVAEMTGNLVILAPAMIAVGIAYLIVRRTGQTIYRSQARDRDAARARASLADLG